MKAFNRLKENIYRTLFTERSAKILALAGLLLILIAIVVFLVNGYYDLSKPIDTSQVGQFGDLIGGLIGSLWALAAFIMFYVALKDQRTDFKTNKDILEAQIETLKLQNDEFKAQVDEMKSTRKVFTEQSKLLQTQRFENTFFEMLKIQRENSKNIEYVHRDGQLTHRYVGYRVFEKIFRDFLELAYTLPKVLENNDAKLNQQFQAEKYIPIIFHIIFYGKNYIIGQVGARNLNISYDGRTKLASGLLHINLYYESSTEQINTSGYQAVLGHYFRHLYQTVQYVDDYIFGLKNSKKERELKYSYVKKIRAQLSNDELSLLFLNSLTEIGKPWKEFINQYFLIKNLPEGYIRNAAIEDNPQSYVELGRFAGVNHMNIYPDIIYEGFKESYRQTTKYGNAVETLPLFSL